MKSEYLEELNKIERICKIALPLMYFAVVSTIAVFVLIVSNQGIANMLEEVGGRFYMIVAIVSSVSFIILFYGMWTLIRLFRNAQKHIIFDHKNLKLVKRLGYLVLYFTITDWIGSIFNYLSTNNIHINLTPIFTDVLLIIMMFIIYQVLRIGMTLKNNDDMTV